jgi:S-DNA-T family DNA segregation ATPase FtsK/SpoIIIE
MMPRRTSKKSKTTKRRTTKSRAKPKQPFLSGISPQRRIEILAIFLILVGVLTLVSLFSQSSGSLTGWWTSNISKVVGWGVYVLPFILIAFGAWFLLRNVVETPGLSTERIIGIILLFIILTVWFHLGLDGGLDEAREGLGGGFIGAAIKIVLVRGLGRPGAIIALIALSLISLILTLDLTMAKIIEWINTLIKKVFNQVRRFIQNLISRLKTALASKRKKLSGAGDQPQADGTAHRSTTSQLGTTSPKKTPGDPDSLYYNHEITKPVWVLPEIDHILDPSVEVPDNGENDRQRARVIEETLRSFGAPAHVVDIRRGPTITLFGVEPDFVESRKGKTRVRVSRITALADDLALALAASRIRIQAPVPGKGYIGIEVPNRQVEMVSLRDVIVSGAYQNLDSPLKIALGKDVAGKSVAADLTAMPHLLIAGTTGAGKSVCINDILTCLLLNMTPDELRLILVDPKRVELTGYNGIPHLLSPVIVEAEHVVGALQWMLREMENRYRIFSETKTRNIADYNTYCESNAERKLPYILVVIDELADLMLLAPDETERTITRLAQLARATGIHLIIATQRPSTDILTGLIKANFPARIAFAVASSVDSRVILDHVGAERLLGRGDMLFQAPDAPAPVRIQTAFISDVEINRLAAYWRGFTVSAKAPQRPDMPAAFQTSQGIPLKQAPLWEEMEEENNRDPKYDEACQIVRDEGQASISLLQRKMRVGYTRAARMIDMMAEKGIISAPDPKTQIREILDDGG